MQIITMLHMHAARITPGFETAGNDTERFVHIIGDTKILVGTLIIKTIFFMA